jgi:hypothetical protein
MAFASTVRDTQTIRRDFHGTEIHRDELVARLVRAGEIEVSGEDIETIGDYFAAGFEFNGPGSFVADFNGLSDYFASVRAAFDDRSIQRGIMVVEGNTIACQTWIEGTFVREFTQSPVGPLQPNGRKVVWQLPERHDHPRSDALQEKGLFPYWSKCTISATGRLRVGP